MLKRKILMVLVFSISFYLFWNVTYAVNSGTVYLTSRQNEVNPGEEIEITVNLQNNKIAACNFYIYFEDTKVEFIDNNSQEDSTYNIKLNSKYINFVWFDKLGGEGAKNGEITTFKFRAKENGLATFTINGEFYDQNGQLIQTDFKEEQIKIGKEESNLQKQSKEEGTNLEGNNSNLQVLRVDKEGLIPSFEKDIQEYYLNVSKDTSFVDVLAISENKNATVEIQGNENLEERTNKIIVKVTSADKTQSKVYTIHVSKTDNFELANTNLEILAIENALLNPPFDTSNTNYEIEVSNQTESLNIFAIPENEKATVQIMGKDNLKQGNNIVTVLVNAQDGFTQRIYKINVNRRNLEQEKKYQEEHAKKKEDLEKAYNIEKTSLNINNSKKQLAEKQNINYATIAVWICIIAIVSLLILMIIWKITKNRKLK